MISGENDDSSSVLKLCWGIIIFCVVVSALFVLYLRKKRRKQILASESSFDSDDYPDELIQIAPSINDDSLKVEFP